MQDTLDILQFFNPSRQHIKEGLIPDCSKALLGGGSSYEDSGFGFTANSGLSDRNLHLSAEVVKALIGEPLTEEELLKVRCSPLLPFPFDHMQKWRCSWLGSNHQLTLLLLLRHHLTKS